MDFLRLEDEFSRDDNTSYTSSIATTNSAGVTEDGDDLHLGAEGMHCLLQTFHQYSLIVLVLGGRTPF